MASILEEFAYGNISPEAQYFTRDSEYGQAIEMVSRNERKLLERLEGAEKIQFEKYVEAQGEANRLTAVRNLIYGFKLGLMMTAETFIGMDDLYSNGNRT